MHLDIDLFDKLPLTFAQIPTIIHAYLSLVKMVENVLKIQQLRIVLNVIVPLVSRAKCAIYLLLFYRLDAILDVRMEVYVMEMFATVLWVIQE